MTERILEMASRMLARMNPHLPPEMFTCDRDDVRRYAERNREFLERCCESEEKSRREQERKKQRYRVEHSREEFLEKTECIIWDPHGQISSHELYELYSLWCISQKLTPYPERSFYLFVRDRAFDYGIIPLAHVRSSDGNRPRGWRGLRKNCSGTEGTEGADNI